MKNPFAKKVVVLFVFAVLAVGIAAANHSGDGTPPLEVAYAHVFGDGTLDRANSRGVIRMAGGSGLYCFKLAFQPREVAVTLADDPTAANQGVGFIKAAPTPNPIIHLRYHPESRCRRGNRFTDRCEHWCTGRRLRILRRLEKVIGVEK